MIYERNMKEFTQGICEAIFETTGCHVTISDINDIRVAGTGEFKHRIGQKIPEMSAFEVAKKNKKTVIITSPGKDEPCKNCQYVHNCNEKYEICTPILNQDDVLGVIGMIATTDEQKAYLQSKECSFIRYAKNMAKLLSTYIGEFHLREKIRIKNEELTTIVENSNNPIICITGDGSVQYINKKAKEMLEYKQKSHENVNINALWPNSLISKALKEGSYKNVICGEEIFISKNNEAKIISSHITKIYENGNIVSVIGSFSDSENLQKKAALFRESNSETSFDTLIGESNSLKEAKENAKTAARYDSTILITGESGTGKELFARAIHDSSNRHKFPFVTINCSAIPETLLESELFGYEGGAFTGANRAGKLGKMEIANKGTFFLDEIGDMNLYLQAKLLRVIQDMTIVRVGGTKSIQLDLRFIAATNKDLETLVKNGEFREDLFYRINVIPLCLPSLRDRKSDIKILAKYFINLNNKRFNKQIKGFTPEALDLLESYNWPGNIRELQNVIEYVSNYSLNGYVDVSDLRTRIKVDDSLELSLEEKVKQFEKIEIYRLLEKYGNNKMGKELAAKDLGISRASLYRKLK